MTLRATRYGNRSYSVMAYELNDLETLDQLPEALELGITPEQLPCVAFRMPDSTWRVLEKWEFHRQYILEDLAQGEFTVQDFIIYGAASAPVDSPLFKECGDARFARYKLVHMSQPFMVRHAISHFYKTDLHAEYEGSPCKVTEVSRYGAVWIDLFIGDSDTRYIKVPVYQLCKFKEVNPNDLL